MATTNNNTGGRAMKERIQKQIARLNKMTVHKTTERVHATIDRALLWIAAGGYCRYSNEDCDILQSLLSVERDLA